MASKPNKSRRNTKAMLFGAWNYKMLGIGLLLVVIGFTAMYLENEVNGFISLFISPILIMAGYVTVIFAIMKHDDSSSPSAEHSSG